MWPLDPIWLDIKSAWKTWWSAVIEQAQLLDALESPRSELIVVYGRRRIGKTYLIRNTYADAIRFEFAGMHRGSYKDQLKNFHKALTKQWKRAPVPEDWIEAFDLLGKYLGGLKSKGKRVVFIDEFPWLDTRRSGFLPAFSTSGTATPPSARTWWW